MRFNKHVMLLLLSLMSSTSFAAESDWTGFYVGGNVGESIDSSNADTYMYSNGGVASSSYVTSFNQVGQQSLDFNNFIAGVQSGYNYQIHNWVLGVEASYDPATQATASQTSSVPGNPGDYAGNSVTTITQTLYQSWNFTVHPRLGYVLKHFLIYATGGFALAKINYSSATTWNGTTQQLNNNNTVINQALPGWAAGAGVEWQFIPEHWSLNAQYLYEGFEHFNASNLITSNNIQSDPNASVSQHGNFNSNVLTVGINYIF